MEFQLETLTMAELPSCSYILVFLSTACRILATVFPLSMSWLLNCWAAPMEASQSLSSASLLIFIQPLYRIYKEHNHTLTAKVKYPVWPLSVWTTLLRRALFLGSGPSSSLSFKSSISLIKHSTVYNLMNFWRRSSSVVLWTCSIQGEKQQIFPSNSVEKYISSDLVWRVR